MTPAETCQAIRTKHNLTQEDFGRLIGVHAMSISRWERGEIIPAMQTQILLFIIFHCDDKLLAEIQDFKPS